MRSALWLAMLVISAGAAYGAPAEEKADPKVVDANTEFGFGMLEELVSASGGKTNVVISPASLSLALSMTYNGASGTTKDAMAKALGYTGLSLDQINAGNKALLANLEQPGEGVELAVANSLWARKGVKFKPDFLARNKDCFKAEINTLNSADKINAWVSDKTHGKIDQIVSQVDPSHILFLVNAVYFKGLWSAPFDEKLTKDGEFTLVDGKTKTVRMMHNTRHYEYLEGDGFQLVNLPYGKGRISMYVLLPAVDGSGSVTLLTPANVAKWFEQMRGHSREVDLTLPKFKLEYKAEAEAKAALTALGMGVAFDPSKADFSNMCPVSPAANVFIGEVVHKTYIDVYEKGTEAAAATSVGMRATAMPPHPIPKMLVDHPFFFAIRNNMTGEMLFMGSVVEPK